MSESAQFIFENGRGERKNENGEVLMDMEVHVPEIKTLTSLGQYLEYQVDHQQAPDAIMKEVEAKKKKNKKENDEKNDDNTEKKKKTWTAYSPLSKYNFIHHMIAKCPKKIVPVARSYGVHPRTSQRWWSDYNEDPDKFLKIKSRGNLKKLGDDHKDFLMEMLDNDPAVTADDAIDELSANFERIKIGKTAVHDFIKNDMNFTFKKAEYHAEKRNNEDTLEARFKWATDTVNSGANFLRNCVFIDESGFYVNLKRAGAWGPKGKTPIVEVEKTQAVSHSILGAISVYGVINTSVRLPSVATTELVPVSAGKKRKLDTVCLKNLFISPFTTLITAKALAS